MDEEEYGCPIGIIFQSLLVGGPFEGEVVTNDLPVPGFVVKNEHIVPFSSDEVQPYPQKQALRQMLAARMDLHPPFDFQSFYLRRHVYEAVEEGLIYRYLGWFQG